MKYSTDASNIETLDVDAIVVGIYEDEEYGENAARLTSAIEPFLSLPDFTGKSGQKMILYNITDVKASRLLLVGLGEKSKANHETVRKAASMALRYLRKSGSTNVAIEALHGDAQATAEGVSLGLYRYVNLKTKDLETRKSIDEVILVSGDEEEISSWNKGLVLAEGQNHARYLNETPANICHPTWFVEQTKLYMKDLANVKIVGHDEAWAEEQGMGAFLSVAKGSDQPAKFLEIIYSGGNEGDSPLVYIGKGITFDTGGISLKPGGGMGAMKGDMAAAGAVVGTLFAIAKLGLKLNVIGIAPLTENMPSGKATRPADVVTASNGKTIQVDNTDAEGRMVLSDALVYAEKTYKPHTVIDLATLTGAKVVALGTAYIAAFSRSDELWEDLEEVGSETYDRFWRMPLDAHYRKQLDTEIADMSNIGGREAGSCTAAMFLSEFIEMERWAHLDIAGSARSKGKGYHPKGANGRPVRALTLLSEKFVKE